MVIENIPKDLAYEWAGSLVFTPALGLLLGGDRWRCVDKVFVAKMGDEIVGISTVASKGELMDNRPTIVAIYVVHDYRRQGVGYRLLETTVDSMFSEGLTPIRLDVLSTKARQMINHLPVNKKQRLNIIDQSGEQALDMILDK